MQGYFLLHHISKILIKMRITTFIVSIQILLAITGCSKSEQPGSNTPKLVWKVPLLNGTESFTFNPVFYKDIVIYGVKYARLDRSEKPSIIALKKSTGEKVWEWKDALKDYDNFSAGVEYYIYQNIFVLSSGPRVYAIDLKTGKSLWNTQAPQSGNLYVVGSGSKIYHIELNFDKTKSSLCMADIATGNWKPIFVIEQPDMVSLFGSRMLVDKDSDGENYLYFTYAHTDLNYTSSKTHLAKLNIRTDSIVFDRLPPVKEAHSLTAVDDKYVYLGGQALIACDKKTGDLQQSYPLPTLSNALYGTTYCFVRNNKLFAPTTYPRFLCYDVGTASTLWRDDDISIGSTSKLIYHDDIIYYVSGADGLLHAIDENGKRLWKFQSPDKKGSSGNFDNAIAIDEQENRVYVSTYFNAVCYETIKK